MTTSLFFVDWIQASALSLEEDKRMMNLLTDYCKKGKLVSVATADRFLGENRR
jgi:hypothetical protein